MDLVSKSEALYRRECLAKRIGKLFRGSYLPVEVATINANTKAVQLGPTGRHSHINFFLLNNDLGIFEPEVLCGVHKLGEMWNGKRELVEQSNLQVFEARGCDPTKNRFQVSTNTSEREEAKVRKCNVCRDWRQDELPLHVTVGNSECKASLENLELGHK